MVGIVVLILCVWRFLFSGSKLVISSQVHISKRYLKYLTKKFLKKNQLEVSLFEQSRALLSMHEV